MAARVCLLTVAAIGAACSSGGNGVSGPQPPGGPSAAASIVGEPPPAVVAGESYAFQPSAGPAGLHLTFSISGQPSWAQFDPTTGGLSGTPGEGDVGRYDDIAISVSDGTRTARLGPFTIDVLAPGTPTGSATLGWSSPDTRTDGSPLLGGAVSYRIQYGQQSENYTHATVVRAGLSSYVVPHLIEGTWYFAITAFDEFGLESPPSNEVSKSIEL